MVIPKTWFRLYAKTLTVSPRLKWENMIDERNEEGHPEDPYEETYEGVLQAFEDFAALYYNPESAKD